MSPQEAAALADRLRSRPRRAIEAARRAAVLVPLVIDQGEPRLVLTRRAEDMSSHRGQVAFPGGHAEPTDRDLIETALREAEEEVALGREHVEVLGMIDDFPTHDGRMTVTPVLGLVRSLPQLRPEPGEVARVFHIPVSALQRREGWRVEAVSWRAQRWPVYHFDHDGETLWGLSAYITLQVLALLPGGTPYDLDLEPAFRTPPV